MLADFVVANQGEIIRRCQAKVAARSLPSSPKTESAYGVPVFLPQLVEALRLGAVSNTEIHYSASLHGQDLLREGLTVAQVVHDYGDVCQSITELAGELDVAIDADDFRALNRCLDDAIGSALTEFAREKNQRAVRDEATRGSDRLGLFANELRSMITVAIVAFDGLESGHVGAAGESGTLLRRSLVQAVDLIGRALPAVLTLPAGAGTGQGPFAVENAGVGFPGGGGAISRFSAGRIAPD